MPVVSAAPANPPVDEAKAKFDALVKRAEQALLEDHRLDYELPFIKKSVDQSETVEKLMGACRAGHRPSCWIAAEIAPQGDQARLYEIVASNCRNGDQLSCRALPDQMGVKEPAYTDLPGTLGRVTCAELDVCDVEGLKRECAAGFGRSCQALDVHVDEKERARLAVFQKKNFKDDCAAGITYGCNAFYDLPSEEQFELYQAECRVERWTCGLLREGYDQLKRPNDARDALELSCMYGRNPKTCAELGNAYLDHLYEEPVQGRGQALLDRSCRIMATYTNRLDDCKRAKK